MIYSFAKHKILTPEGSEWLDLWQKSPEREVFAHPEYARLFEDSGTFALAFYWQAEEGSALFPFLLRRLRNEPFWRPEHGEIYDITTPYGYGGPVVISGKPGVAFFQKFFAAFHQWAGQNGVVSEFVRFSLFTEAFRGYTGEIVHANDNIVCELEPDYKQLWGNFRHKVRKNVHAAVGKGVSIEIDSQGRHLQDFMHIWYHTLRRRHADAKYFWPLSFFENIGKSLPDNMMYFHAVYQGQVVASELILTSKNRIYSFLGGTLQPFFALKAGDLLKNAIVKWGHDNGYARFVIGGGYKPHDGIFAFKKSFAPRGIYPFYTGRKIFDHQLYNSLVMHAEKPPAAGFFPGYRS